MTTPLRTHAASRAVIVARKQQADRQEKYLCNKENEVSFCAPSQNCCRTNGWFLLLKAVPRFLYMFLTLSKLDISYSEDKEQHLTNLYGNILIDDLIWNFFF